MLTLEDLEKIIECFKEEVKEDPDYVPGYDTLPVGQMIAFNMILKILKKEKEKAKKAEPNDYRGVYCPFCKERVRAWKWDEDNNYKCRKCDKMFTEKDITDALIKEKENAQ